MKQFILIVTIFSFILEPYGFIPKAQANAQKCQSGPQDTKKDCSGNQSVVGQINSFTERLGQIQGGEGNRRDAIRLQQQGDQGRQGMEQKIAQCTSAGQDCMSACDQEIGRKQAMNQDTTQEEQAKEQCKKEMDESNAKDEGGLKELMALLQALMGLIAAMKGNKEDKPEDLAKKEEEEKEICDTPEGAFLVECQCEKNAEGKCIIEPKNTASRLGGGTFGGLAGGAIGGDVQARPASADFESKLNDNAGVGSAAARGAGAGGASGLGAASAPTLGNPNGVAEDPSVNADIHKGFHGASGGGGGFGSFGGGGGSKVSGYKGGGFGKSAISKSSKGKAALNKKLKSAMNRKPASYRGGRAGGPFGDNFFTIRQAYQKNKPTLYNGTQPQQ